MTPPPDAVIQVEGLVKTFGTFRAVDGLDLCVMPGEVHGFLGPNGAGKSTTLRVLLGLYRRDAGTVTILGLDPQQHPADVTRRTAYVPGDVQLWPQLTGRQVLDALAGLRGAGGHDRALERRLIADFALDPRKRVRSYSKGNRQKVALIAAFAARTPLLVLDEPTSGLDPLMEEVFRSCVREAAYAGRTVLLSSHLLDEVEALCEAVTIVKDGRLVESGRLSAMRHLAATRIAAVLPDGERVELSVPTEAVPRTLGDLLHRGGTEFSCTPATLEDLFLRHYEVAAR
jgi:ABC-2 type transport system ATP-binding protein